MERTEWNSTRNLFSFLLALVAVALVLAAFMPAEARNRESRGQGSGGKPIMVLLNTDITDSLIIELAEYGKIRGWIENRGLEIDLEVDGGVTKKNIGRAASAGANIFVAGTSIFAENDRTLAIDVLRKAAQKAGP